MWKLIVKSLCFSYPGPLDYDDFTIESVHVAGGRFLTDHDILELMVCSTDKLNLALLHRSGEQNTKRADEIFKLVIYIIENVEKLGKDFCLEDLLSQKHLMRSTINWIFPFLQDDDFILDMF